MSKNMIEMTLENPVKPLEDKTEEKDKDRSKCTASVIHQTDKCLRKIVSEKIRETRKIENIKKEDIQIKANHFNSKKDELLEDLKTGFTTLPTNIVTGIGKKEPNAVDNLKTVISELYDLKINEQKNQEFYRKNAQNLKFFVYNRTSPKIHTYNMDDLKEEVETRIEYDLENNEKNDTGKKMGQ